MSDMETAEDALDKFKLQAAVKRAPETAMADTLRAKTLEELKKMAKAYSVRGYSSLNKAGLVGVVGEALRDAGRMENLLYILDEHEWRFFRRVAEEPCLQDNGASFEDTDLLQGSGYVQLYFHEDKFFYVVPEEIRTVYAALMADGFLRRKERSDLIHRYAMAAINLYGVIGWYDFIDIFNSQNAVKTNEGELFLLLIRQIYAEKGYCFWDEYIVSDTFEEDDFKGVNLLLHEVGDKPRYVPPKKELLKYADPDYYEQTVATRALARYLRETLLQDGDTALALCEAVHDACAAETPISGLFAIFEEFKITFSIAQAKELAALLMNVSNSTRLWQNNGHTPLEIFDRYERPALRPLPPEPFHTKKVGRNDPCPCGSGKKYKKCCGR